MRPKVTSMVPLKRFSEAGVHLPHHLEFRFETALSEDHLIFACQGADFLLVAPGYPAITARVLENIPCIRMIQSSGTGYDRVDVESAARLCIPVANSPGHNVTTVAEFTIALIIALQRHMVLADREIKAGGYAALRERFFQSGLNEVSDTRLGLVGFGMIGRKVAQLAKLLGSQVSYYDALRAPANLESELDVKFRPFDELLSCCDVISLHLPLNKETREMMGDREFNLMPEGALFINTSRGELVDPKALAHTLEIGHLGGAAVDTVSPEPPPPDHPLLTLSPSTRDRLLITPHVAGITRGALNRMLGAALENILRVVAGVPPQNVINGVAKARLP